MSQDDQQDIVYIPAIRLNEQGNPTTLGSGRSVPINKAQFKMAYGNLHQMFNGDVKLAQEKAVEFAERTDPLNMSANDLVTTTLLVLYINHQGNLEGAWRDLKVNSRT